MVIPDEKNYLLPLRALEELFHIPLADRNRYFPSIAMMLIFFQGALYGYGKEIELLNVTNALTGYAAVCMSLLLWGLGLMLIAVEGGPKTLLRLALFTVASLLGFLLGIPFGILYIGCIIVPLWLLAITVYAIIDGLHKDKH